MTVAHFLDGPWARELREIPDLETVHVPVMKDELVHHWWTNMDPTTRVEIHTYRRVPLGGVSGTFSDPKYYSTSGWWANA